MNTPPPHSLFTFRFFNSFIYLFLHICARRGSQKNRLPLHARLADVSRVELQRVSACRDATEELKEGVI